MHTYRTVAKIALCHLEAPALHPQFLQYLLSVSPPPRAQSEQVDTGYWDWCESQFDMSGFRSTSSGFMPSRAKCARDSLLAQVDVALREVEKIFHPQALMYATRADMRALPGRRGSPAP